MNWSSIKQWRLSLSRRQPLPPALRQQYLSAVWAFLGYLGGAAWQWLALLRVDTGGVVPPETVWWGWVILCTAYMLGLFDLARCKGLSRGKALLLLPTWAVISACFGPSVYAAVADAFRPFTERLTFPVSDDLIASGVCFLGYLVPPLALLCLKDAPSWYTRHT